MLMNTAYEDSGRERQDSIMTVAYIILQYIKYFSKTAKQSYRNKVTE